VGVVGGWVGVWGGGSGWVGWEGGRGVVGGGERTVVTGRGLGLGGVGGCAETFAIWQRILPPVGIDCGGFVACVLTRIRRL